MHAPNENESAHASLRDEEPTLRQAEPYRSPAEVSEKDSSAGARKLGAVTLGIWLLLGGGLAAGGVLSYTLLKPVPEFGENRAGPPKPLVEHIEEFGWERRAIEPKEVLDVNEILELSQDPVLVPDVEAQTDSGAALELPQP